MGFELFFQLFTLCWIPFVENNELDGQFRITYVWKTNAMEMIWVILCGISIILLIYRFYVGQVFIEKPVLKGRYFRKKSRIKGIGRKYSFYVPSTIPQNIPLIFILHGANDDGDRFRKRLSYRWDELADKEGFIVVYPTGYKRSWNDCRLNAKYPARKKGIDDFLFLDYIKRKLADDHRIVISDVYIFGYSNGGQLVNKISMEHPGWAKGAFTGCANIPTPENLDIQKNSGLPKLVLLQGTSDKCNPFYGGLVKLFRLKNLGSVRSAFDSIGYWKEMWEINAEPETEIYPHRCLNDNTRIEKRSWCKDKQEVLVQFVVHSGGHSLPDLETKFPRILGKTNRDINLANEVWSCFKKF